MVKKPKLHVIIAEEVLKNLIIKLYNNELYTYKNGVYIKDISIIEREILAQDEGVTKSTRNEIFEYLRIKLSAENVAIENKYINFKNCLYDLDKKLTINHTPSVFSINQINADYIDSDYINMDVENFLDEVTSYNTLRKKTILQIIGYCMTSNVQLQKAFIFYGKTADNGKSTLLDVISELIGKDNTCHVSIHNMQNGRFFTSELKSKLLNSVGEVSIEKLGSVDILKSVITGDLIAVEEKHKNRCNIRPYAKHIMLANRLPQVDDNTNGWYRRLHLVNFDANFSLEQKRNFNIEKLITKGALNYLARISLDAYLELLNSLIFANEKESNILINDYKNNANNISIYNYLNSKFFNRFINSSKNLTFSRNSLYSNYLDYCSLANLTDKVGKSNFYSYIRENNLFTEITINGNHNFRYLK